MTKSNGQVLHTCAICGKNFYGNPFNSKGYKKKARCVNCANECIEDLEKVLDDIKQRVNLGLELSKKVI